MKEHDTICKRIVASMTPQELLSSCQLRRSTVLHWSPHLVFHGVHNKLSRINVVCLGFSQVGLLTLSSSFLHSVACCSRKQREALHSTSIRLSPASAPAVFANPGLKRSDRALNATVLLKLCTAQYCPE